MSEKKIKKSRGRPPLPIGQVREFRISFRVTSAELHKLESEAAKAGKTLGELMRDRAGVGQRKRASAGRTDAPKV